VRPSYGKTSLSHRLRRSHRKQQPLRANTKRRRRRRRPPSHDRAGTHVEAIVRTHGREKRGNERPSQRGASLGDMQTRKAPFRVESSLFRLAHVCERDGDDDGDATFPQGLRHPLIWRQSIPPICLAAFPFFPHPPPLLSAFQFPLASTPSDAEKAIGAQAGRRGRRRRYWAPFNSARPFSAPFV